MYVHLFYLYSMYGYKNKKMCIYITDIYLITCIFAWNASAVITFSVEVTAAHTFRTDSLVTAAHQYMVVYFHPTPPPIPKDPKGNMATSFKTDGNDVSRLFPPVITTVLAVEVLEWPLNILVPPWRQFRGCASSAEHKDLVEKRYMVSSSIPTELTPKDWGL